MRILVVSHTYIVDLNREKLRALTQLSPDIEVTVVVPKLWQPGGVQNQTIVSQPLTEGRFRVIPISNLSQNNQSLLVFGSDLIALLQEFRPQIIHIEQGAKALGYAQLILLNKLLGLKAKNVFFTWWNLPYQVKFPISWLQQYNLQNTDGAIAGNQDGAEVLRQQGYQGIIKVMPQLGVDKTRFYSQPQPTLATQLGIQPQEFVVGFVGRFVPEKGLLTLLSALAQITEIPWKWLLLGRGVLQTELLAKAEENGIKDRLILVESVPHDEVPKYINLMNVLVLPSETTYQFKTITAAGWKEQFGHVLIEAMACQIPVIGSDSGEIPYVIGDAGLIFPEGNVAALENCLRQVMSQPELRAKLGSLGYERAIARYTNQALAVQLLDFYQQILENP